ncbi:uncharacterized protein LOC119741516 [Patiria miniata]|uniref:Uncharacterized protein n=1 Tax=Patiria miniata TaxID=46514 RepID=A0A914BCR5_PATMI|nr:uncharacterized protein LOC119741516 [Patiria miniata]
MKPDQHRKKRSAQYKRKHGISQKTDATKSKANSSSAVKCADASDTSTRPKESGQNLKESNHNSSSDRHDTYRARNRDFTQDESEEVRSFARRKIESNWDRYEPLDDDVDESYNYDGLKGADFKALLSLTGDASSQFRFKDEQLWEEEESDLEKTQESEGIPAIDCHDLSQRLMAIPLQVRLNIDCVFFEPPTLKSFEELASRHKEKLDSGESSVWTPVSSDKSSPIFSARNQAVDAGGSDSICLDSDEEEEVKDETSRPREEEKEPPLDLSISHSQDNVKHSSLPELSRGLQDVPDTDKEPIQDAPATPDVRSGLDKSEHLEDDEMFVNREQTAAEARKCNVGREDQPGTQEQSETTVDPVSNQGEIDNSDTRSTLQSHTKLAVVSPPKIQAKTKPLSEPKTDDIDDDDDELNFLLGLENPVQTRSKPDVTSGQLEEDEGILDEGRERPASQPVDADKKPKPGHVQALLKTESTSQNGTDSLEDWLDSVLDD